MDSPRAFRATQAIRETLTRTDSYPRLRGIASNIPELDELLTKTNKYFTKEGKLIGLATTGSKRDPAFPNLPTVAEFVPGFETRLWIGIAVRTGTPKSIIDRLAAAASKAAQDPAVVAALEKQGFQPLIMNPEQFEAFYRAEHEKWGKVIKDTGMDKN